MEPFIVYCYKSLQQSIEQLIKRKGFVDKCEEWKSRKVPDGYLDLQYMTVQLEAFQFTKQRLFSVKSSWLPKGRLI